MSKSFSCARGTVTQLNAFRYKLCAGFNNTSEHFTAIIKSNNTYHRFNDIHPQGCHAHDGHLPVDLALFERTKTVLL